MMPNVPPLNTWYKFLQVVQQELICAAAQGCILDMHPSTRKHFQGIADIFGHASGKKPF